MIGRRPLVCLLAFLLLERGPLQGAAPPRAALPRLTTDQAWELLPRQNPPLPGWARTLAGSLPRTTAGMLELDHLHRARNPLGTVLASRIRWAAADALHCDYARRLAAADLQRVGSKHPAPGHDGGKAEKAALAFARNLTVAGHLVTDEEVANLLDLFGPDKLVAIVHTVAFANFQNRVFLALGVQVEPEGPLPPVEVRFDLSRNSRVPVPSRRSWEEANAVARRVRGDDRMDWEERPYPALEKSLDRQKGRKSRIPLPGPERMARIPQEARKQASRVVWTAVSMGYQPELTQAWFAAMRAFQGEARLDPVFSSSLFWVITRTNECFY